VTAPPRCNAHCNNSVGRYGPMHDYALWDKKPGAALALGAEVILAPPCIFH
jgi:hypothetical protein